MADQRTVCAVLVGREGGGVKVVGREGVCVMMFILLVVAICALYGSGHWVIATLLLFMMLFGY